MCLAAVIGNAQAQAPVQKISGEVVASDAANLRVKSSAGEVTNIRLADNLRVSARGPSSPAMIVPGAFIGTTAAPGADGMLVASEVHIFAESMRGTGEGHRPMDNGPGNTMTNATVTGVTSGAAKSRNSIINAAVADVGAAAGALTITLTYKGGEKKVIVPDNIPIVTIEPGDRSLLVPGAHVVVYAAVKPDGALTADRINVGKNGFVPTF
jgi:hypothetical protein